jgi:hypothetical protein
MKQLKVFFLGALFLAAVNQASAQVDLKINPIGLLFSNLNVAAEFGVADNIGIEATAGFGWNKFNLDDDAEFRSTLIRGGVNARYYFNPSKGIDRFYGGIYTRYAGGKLTAEDETTREDATSTRLSVGFIFGYKVVARNEHLLFDFGLGAGRAIISRWEYEDGSEVNTDDIPLLNIDIPFYISVGYRF